MLLCFSEICLLGWSGCPREGSALYPAAQAGWVIRTLKPGVPQWLAASQTTVLFCSWAKQMEKDLWFWNTVLPPSFTREGQGILPPSGRLVCTQASRIGRYPGLLSGPGLPNSSRNVQDLPQATRTCSHTMQRYKVWPSWCDSSKTFPVIKWKPQRIIFVEILYKFLNAWWMQCIHPFSQSLLRACCCVPRANDIAEPLSIVFTF